MPVKGQPSGKDICAFAAGSLGIRSKLARGRFLNDGIQDENVLPRGWLTFYVPSISFLLCVFKILSVLLTEIRIGRRLRLSKEHGGYNTKLHLMIRLSFCRTGVYGLLLTLPLVPGTFWPESVGNRKLCREVRPHLPTSVLDMSLNNQMVRFQECWSFGESGVPLHCHLSRLHSGPEW